MVALHLPSGSLLVQPGGTIYALVTCDKMVMMGMMHLHARAVDTSLRQTVLEVKNLSVTNELMAAEYRPKMRQLLGLWTTGMSERDHRGGNSLKECELLLKVSPFVPSPFNLRQWGHSTQILTLSVLEIE